MKYTKLLNYQKSIIREEISRLIILTEARKRLSNHDYNVISESINKHGINSFLNEQEAPTEDQPESEPAENKKTPTPGADLMKDLSRETKNFWAIGPGKNIRSKGGESFTQIDIADYIIRYPDIFGENDVMQAGTWLLATLGAERFAKLYDGDPSKGEDVKPKSQKQPDGGNPPPAPQAGGAAGGGVPPQIKNMEDDFENPKAPGIFTSILDSYKYAFGANANMWKGIYNWFGKAEKAPPARQDDLLLQLLMKLIDKMEARGGEAAKKADELEKEVEQIQDEPEEEVEELDDAVSIRRGKNSLQSRMSKLFPDLARKKGTYYYRKAGDKPGDQGRIVSKNTSALSAILSDIEAQLKGSDIQINEAQKVQLAEALILLSVNSLLTEATLPSFKGKIRQVLQRVRDSEEDPKRKRKKIDKFLYRLRAYANQGNLDRLPSKYKDIKGAESIPKQYKTLNPAEQKAALKYAKDYAQRQFMGDDKSVRGKAKGDAPPMTKQQMIKQVPKIKSGIVNISQIIGPKLKAAGYDLKSKEGGDIQKRILKVLRRFLRKELERIGKEGEVKLLAKFSRSSKKKVNETIDKKRERYISYYSKYMLEGIINELQNT